MLTVCKFGGSSLSDSARFLNAAEVVRQDPDRRVVVVSAAGKRFDGDAKITDLLYLCHAHLVHGVSCWDLYRRVRERYAEIWDGCGLALDLGPVFDEIYENLGTSEDYAASRGEYLTARLMAELLDYTFIDAKDWLRFSYDGKIDQTASYEALSDLAGEQRVVTPGFYGALPNGAVHTLSRGGSDVTGAMAAAALHADLYENWTDVPGILEADPRVIPTAKPMDYLRYSQLSRLTQCGLQVLHRDAVEPVRQAGIPMRICAASQPEAPGTLVCQDCPAQRLSMAGSRGLTLPGHPGKLAVVGAVFPKGRGPDLLAALEGLDHVVLTVDEEELRLLTAEGDYPEAVKQLYARAKKIFS